jgi:prevent-host-death family protein
MKTVGTFEAKTHLSSLLEQIERGEEITITRHGRAVARLVPLPAVDRGRLEDTVAAEGVPARAPAGRAFGQGADRRRAAVTGCVLDASSVLAWSRPATAISRRRRSASAWSW